MEFPTLDKQCAYPECKRLDFLPLKCSHCLAVFCKDHLAVRDHACSKAVDVQATDEEVATQGKKIRMCALEGCSEKVYPTPCKICHRFYCKYHQKDLHGCLEQHPVPSAPANIVKKDSSSDIKCSVESCTELMLPCRLCQKAYCRIHQKECHGCLDKKRARREKFEAPKREFQAAKSAVDKIVDANIEKARTLTGAKLATANKIQLMRLKQRAVGHKKVADSEKIFFLVHWKGDTDSTELQKKAVFVCRSWSVGRTIDSMSEYCALTNKNNMSGSPQLRLFNMDGEKICEELSTIMNDLLRNEVLVDGGNVLLDYDLPAKDCHD